MQPDDNDLDCADSRRNAMKQRKWYCFSPLLSEEVGGGYWLRRVLDRSSDSNVAVRMWRVLPNLGQFAESRRRSWVGADGWRHIPGLVLLRSDTGRQPMSRTQTNGAACRCLG